MLEENEGPNDPLEIEEKKNAEKPKEEKKPAAKKRNINQEVLLADKVLKELGRPTDLYSCVAINLYDNRYRVNLKLKNGQISDSFFIRLNNQGEIAFADPKLNRKY